MIERIFMASSTGDDAGLKDGQYKTAAEAEMRAYRLGWDWVVVYAHTVENGRITDLQKRYYRPVKPAQYKLRTPEEVEQLRRELSTPDPKPLSADEVSFFAEYERQMEAPSGKNS